MQLKKQLKKDPICLTVEKIRKNFKCQISNVKKIFIIKGDK